MIAELAAWGPILDRMSRDAALLARAQADNPWFSPGFVRMAVSAMSGWWSADALAALRARHAPVAAPKRVGLVLAGNIPLVGLHDLLMVLLSGHKAILKPSHKDQALILALLEASSPALRERVEARPAIAPQDIDLLIATGSNATARAITETYAGIPMLLRQNRFSVAVLDGGEDATDLEALAGDVLAYHGLGCRSVSCVLVHEGMPLAPLVAAFDRYPATRFAPDWQHALRYARAIQTVLDSPMPRCTHLVLEQAQQVAPGKFGTVNIVRYRDAAHVASLLDGLADQLQCIVGTQRLAFGCAQSPGIDDFADGVDTLAWLCGG
jgi:hypothetical protein